MRQVLLPVLASGWLQPVPYTAPTRVSEGRHHDRPVVYCPLLPGAIFMETLESLKLYVADGILTNPIEIQMHATRVESPFISR